MKRVSARVPLRADLAGGTLDLWPLYLFHPGARTVNVAISLWAECEILPLSDSSIEVVLTDTGFEGRYDSIRELAADPQVSLVARAVEHFHLSGIRITTRTEAPRGSGLGGSSALAVALVRALSLTAGRPVEGDELIHLVRDLETRLLGLPAGVQDYYPPVYGGLAALHLDPGRIVRHPVAIAPGELARHFVLHYSGVAHFSGTNNWEMYKRHIEGDARVTSGLAAIARIAHDMEKALESHDFEAAGAALGAEWDARKKLVDGITTPEVDAAIAAAVGAGAWAGKVCGAGGGGCIVFLTPPHARDAVIRALGRVPGRVLDVAPTAAGLTDEEAAEQTTFSFGHRRGRATQGEPVEQLYHAAAPGDTGPYRPWILAEASITFDAPRHGVHRSVTRTLIAPADLQSGRPDWNAAVPVNEKRIDLRTSPEPGRELPPLREPEIFREAEEEAEEALRQLLLDQEELVVYHNPTFRLFSQPEEDREAFLKRCMQEARRMLEDDAERLEKTYRRRIDQMRETAERDQRRVESKDESHRSEIEHQEVGIAWGQTLYNITAGRPATTDSPRTTGEADAFDKIAQLQRSWDREREVRQEELTASARSIEEVVVVPVLRGVEVRKYLVVWSPATFGPGD